MKVELLDALSRFDFQVRVGLVGTPSAAIRSYAMQPEVKELTEAINAGKVTERELESWVDEKLKDLKLGFRFEHTDALTAIAVAVSNSSSDRLKMAYLVPLSLLECSEIIMSTVVAKQLLRDN